MSSANSTRKDVIKIFSSCNFLRVKADKMFKHNKKPFVVAPSAFK